ncbi:hypothetical protein DFH07DRAFT_799753 [Mycena maculata]|uniref:Uncharacterized protein n=1 Tax=Mycena maculata TaxID=230809 RepID=A0AAD7JYE2_9AGAR|nr:hypothetical protein DFH07DRAFT_799753 [Mycena maculata]
MPLFFRDHHDLYTRRVNAPPQIVLELLRDPPAIVQLSPLNVSVSVDPTDLTKYTIADSILLLFGAHMQIKFGVKIKVQNDGMHAESAAGLGTWVTSTSTSTARAVSDWRKCMSIRYSCSCPSSGVSLRNRTTSRLADWLRSSKSALGLE